ncbi:MAG TPA: fimbria/pilus outer membrane usher protein [Cedecea sp.]|jgi:outer membrane usher protein FimD/PapC|nr:fimbria/pilus outer membrane usher protein [Enterobacteriaceae bacterium RIT693]
MISLDTKKKLLAVCIGLSFYKPDEAAAATEFNTYILDVNDRDRVDLSRFSNDGYVMPGEYLLDVKINDAMIGQRTIRFITDPQNPDASRACLPADLVGMMALKPEAAEKIRYWNGNQCVDISGIEGATVSNRIGQGVLQITIPQAWMKYKDANWTPPEQWDRGIPGLLVDYNLTGQIGKRYGKNDVHSSYNSFSSYGTAGANVGSLRLRADYQAWSARNKLRDKGGFAWNQIYGFVPLPEQGARFAVGEIYHDSSIFSNFRMTGASLRSDERMLPPSLQGFAPEVRGTAKSNAKVTLSQDGRILYETTVPAGPFVIQDLNSSVRGKINVRIEEDNGSVSTYDVNTASVPYLTRPGSVRYNLAMGMPSNTNHRVYGQGFGLADISWGLSNNWSLYGGALLGGSYNAVNAGVGVNLNALGAVSLDVTQSFASLPGRGRDNGMSVKVQYSKRFDEYDSQITFAGYRFSQRKYMDMSQYLDARYEREREDYGSREKQSYTVSASKTFFADSPSKAFTTYINYNHLEYWNRPTQERIDFSVSKMMNIGSLQGVSVSLSAYKSKYHETRNDYGGSLNISLPLGQGRRGGYNMQVQNSDITQTGSYSDYSDPNNNWQLNSGMNRKGKALGSGYYTHESPYGTFAANTSYQQDSYASLSASMRGGATATAQGAALHRNGFGGGSRIMVNTGNVSGVPINNGKTTTNRFGVGVVSDVPSYFDTTTSIDVNKLANDVEATRAVVQGTLTEGAIGYRNFAVVRGEKMFAALRTANGEAPPFGAIVLNQSGREVSVVNDDGSVYLTGVQKEEVLDVAWGGSRQCRIKVPGNYQSLSQLLLPCE